MSKEALHFAFQGEEAEVDHIPLAEIAHVNVVYELDVGGASSQHGGGSGEDANALHIATEPGGHNSGRSYHLQTGCRDSLEALAHAIRVHAREAKVSIMIVTIISMILVTVMILISAFAAAVADAVVAVVVVAAAAFDAVLVVVKAPSQPPSPEQQHVMYPDFPRQAASTRRRRRRPAGAARQPQRGPAGAAARAGGVRVGPGAGLCRRPHIPGPAALAAAEAAAATTRAHTRAHARMREHTHAHNTCLTHAIHVHLHSGPEIQGGP